MVKTMTKKRKYTRRDAIIDKLKRPLKVIKKHPRIELATAEGVGPVQFLPPPMPLAEYTYNAIIDKVQLGFEVDGDITMWLTLDTGDDIDDNRLKFGGFSVHDAQVRGIFFLTRILQLTNATTCDAIRGTAVRIKTSVINDTETVVALGHIIDEEWFRPSDWLTT